MIKIQKRIAKFDIKDILPIGLTIVVTGIAIAYGMDVMGDQAEDMCDNSYEHFEEGTCFVCNSSHNNFNTTDNSCYNGTTGTLDSFAGWSGGSAAYNGTANAIAGVGKLPEKLPLIVNVIVAAIVIGILVRYLMVKFG